MVLNYFWLFTTMRNVVLVYFKKKEKEKKKFGSWKRKKIGLKFKKNGPINFLSNGLVYVRPNCLEFWASPWLLLTEVPSHPNIDFSLRFQTFSDSPAHHTSSYSKMAKANTKQHRSPNQNRQWRLVKFSQITGGKTDILTRSHSKI